MLEVIVNESFATQRVTGQQRYATEVARRLTSVGGFRAVRPSGAWATSATRVWGWVQLRLPILSRRAVLLSMTARAPLWSRRQVVVVHDLFVLSNPEWYSRSYIATHAPLLRRQLRTAAAIVAVSQPVADEVAAYRPDAIAVAPNAPSDVFAAVDDQPSTTASEHGLQPGTYFLAVGNRDPRKNLPRLAQAYALLSEQERAAHPLVIVGGTAKIYRDENVGWPSGTVDAGYVTDDELARLYRDAKAVVFVSLAEGFGLPLIEAAAGGARSFVVSDIAVFRWICGDQARYVDPTSPAAIAEGLHAEIVKPSRHELAIGRFDWDKSADTIGRTCRDVARAG